MPFGAGPPVMDTARCVLVKVGSFVLCRGTTDSTLPPLASTCFVTKDTGAGCFAIQPSTAAGL